jgi:hypothetical protein
MSAVARRSRWDLKRPGRPEEWLNRSRQKKSGTLTCNSDDEPINSILRCFAGGELDMLDWFDPSMIDTHSDDSGKAIQTCSRAKPTTNNRLDAITLNERN